MWSLLRTLLVVYLGVLALMWLFQGRLLYQTGMSGHVGTPGSAGMAYESVTLNTEDGLALDAWWIPAEDARASLLFFHGNAGNISHRLRSLEQFHQLGLSVLILDYRGYGRSEGRPSESGTALDARAAWQWLQSREPDLPRILFGRSLGAAVAAELATEVPADAVILESVFRSVPELAQRLYPIFPARWLARFEYPVVEQVRQIAAPLLVIHSEEDEIIPFSEGEAVFAAANEPKQFLRIRGGHNTGFVLSETDYLAGSDTFFEESLPH